MRGLSMEVYSWYNLIEASFFISITRTDYKYHI